MDKKDLYTKEQILKILDNIDEHVPIETPQERVIARLIISYIKNALNEVIK